MNFPVGQSEIDESLMVVSPLLIALTAVDVRVGLTVTMLWYLSSIAFVMSFEAASMQKRILLMRVGLPPPPWLAYPTMVTGCEPLPIEYQPRFECLPSSTVEPLMFVFPNDTCRQ